MYTSTVRLVICALTLMLLSLAFWTPLHAHVLAHPEVRATILKPSESGASATGVVSIRNAFDESLVVTEIWYLDGSMTKSSIKVDDLPGNSIKAYQVWSKAFPLSVGHLPQVLFVSYQLHNATHKMWIPTTLVESASPEKQPSPELQAAKALETKLDASSAETKNSLDKVGTTLQSLVAKSTEKSWAEQYSSIIAAGAALLGALFGQWFANKNAQSQVVFKEQRELKLARCNALRGLAADIREVQQTLQVDDLKSKVSATARSVGTDSAIQTALTKATDGLKSHDIPYKMKADELQNLLNEIDKAAAS